MYQGGKRHDPKPMSRSGNHAVEQEIDWESRYGLDLDRFIRRASTSLDRVYLSVSISPHRRGAPTYPSSCESQSI